MNENSPISTITTSELVGFLDTDPKLFLLDVREPDEVAEWSIPGVVNIPLGQLTDRIDEVPRDKDLVVVCAAGMRATQGAAMLASRGIASRVLEGGMGAWASTYDAVAKDFGEATVVQLRRRGKGCLSYVVGAQSQCVVIDPSLDIEQYENVARARGWKIIAVLDTHLHADHISGARDLVSREGAQLLLSPSDPFDFEFEPLYDGRVIELSSAVSLTVSAIAVPGHTEGSTMYQLGDEALFTGDTLFLESVGRPDLADKADVFAHNLYRSLHERILAFPDSTLVFPAHYGDVVDVHAGELVTKPLGALRTTLPALALSEDEFVAWAVSHVKDRPPNYQRIVRINAGLEDKDDEARRMELGPNRCAVA